MKSSKAGAATPVGPAMVDFHGFLVSVQHKKYLERVYKKEGEFWNRSRFKSKEVISGALECLGRILVIAHSPWSQISGAELKEMVTGLDDIAETGLVLTCLASCTSNVRAILKMREHRLQIEAKLKEANNKFDASNTKLYLLKQKHLELRKQLDNIHHLSMK
ncbi:hypothetical protein V6N13_065489 [Hibiscus sabdariffa]|uniref:Uncharacterized protein n=1 Tax=Hibiscus sabdariffa TaxID=183260 RepID=A0ABR2QR02_9ROSI